MGAVTGKRQWTVVALLLGGALVMTVTLLFPSLWPEDATGRHRDAAVAAFPGAAPSRSETDGADVKEAAAPANATEEVEELAPYGDKDLPRNKSIRGRITDKEGKPVADAVVVAAYKDTRTRPYEMVDASRVRSEEDGFFVLGPLERRSYYVLAIKKKEGVGYAAGLQPGSWVDLVLTPGARVTGTVTARETGEPVAGARVLVKDWTFAMEAQTDEKGQYVVAPLPATANTWSGNQVVVVADGFKRAERDNLLLKDANDHKIDFTLEPGATLSGKVVDARSLQPLAGATVAEGWEPYHRTADTKEDGTYVLANVDVAPNLVFTVRADGYLPQQRQSDGTGRIEFELDASLTLKGIVKTPQEEFAPGARIYLHRVKYAPGFQPVSTNRGQTVTTADQGGSFEFKDVLPGKVALIAFHQEFAPGETKAIDVPVGGPAPDDVEVFLRHGLTVQGEVRDREDNALPSVRVQLSRYGWGKIKGYKYVNNYRWSENPILYTDEQGRFELKGAIPGKHSLSAFDRTHGWTHAAVEGVEGQRITDVILSFAGASITGTFLTSAGEPVPGSWVYANGPKNVRRRSSKWVQTDALGRFKLGGLQEGSYDISASSSFGQPEPLKDIPAGTQDLELKLKITQVLRGEVTSVLTGRALERFFLSIQRQRQNQGRNIRFFGAAWQGWLRSPDGRFERPIQPGTYTLTLKAPGHAPKVINDVIVEEHVEPISRYVALDGGGGIHGTVTDAAGKPIRNAYLNARTYRAPGEAQQQTDWLLGGNDRTDTKGRFFIEGLAPGMYVIQLNMGTRGSAQAQVSVVGAEMVKQDLQLLPTGHIALKVTDEEGKPIQGVYFYFRTEDNQWIGWAQPTNAQGLSTSQPLRMGTAIVQAVHSAQKYVVDNFPVTIQSGKTIVVEVQMKKK